VSARLFALLALLTAAVAATASAAPARTAANECRGLPVCVPVAGPWVVVPPRAPGGRPGTEYLLRCPRGYVVAGTDALVSDRSVDVSIRGEPGSPVAPGVTVGSDALFTAVYTGSGSAKTAFRPFLGCVPATGGGGRSQTVYKPRRLYAVHPIRPLVRRVFVLPFQATSSWQTVVARCPRGSRLLGGTHAVGLRAADEPDRALLATVQSTQRIAGGRVVARARITSLTAPRAELQVHALCTRGGR
jgi:hypothetical protein